MQNTTKSPRRTRTRRGLVSLVALGVSLVTFAGVGATAAHATYQWRNMTTLQSANFAFGSSLSEHYSRRAVDSRLVWSTDGCSAQWLTIWSPYVVDFFEACVRHDFGYRNYGKWHLDRSETRRAFVDAVFLGDLRMICSRVSWVRRPLCYHHADLFYGAVRAFGWTAWYSPYPVRV